MIIPNENDHPLVKQGERFSASEFSSQTSIRKGPFPSPTELEEYEKSYQKGGLTKKYFDRYIEHDKEESKRADKVLLYSFIMTMSLFVMAIFLFILGKDTAATGTLISAFVPVAITLINRLPFGVKKQYSKKIELPEVDNDNRETPNYFYNFEEIVDNMGKSSPNDHVLTDPEKKDFISPSSNEFTESGRCSPNIKSSVITLEAIKGLSRDTIQRGLQNGVLIAKNKILDTLGCDESVSLQELFEYIIDDLICMGYKVMYTDVLSNIYKNHSIPAITIFNTKDKKDGGIIKLNRDYPKSALVEAIFYQYVHIKDDSLPLFQTTQNTITTVTVYDELYKKTNLEYAQFQAEMTAYALMMPPRRIKDDMLRNFYDIEKILKIYSAFEKSSVLKWITIIDTFPCYFAHLLITKDKDDNINNLLIHDSFYYDHTSDPKPFDIDLLLANKDSAVATAIKLRTNVHKASNISGIDYYCYAYYEANVIPDVEIDNISETQSIHYDRVLVIGWDKNIFDTIQILPQK